MSDIDDRLDRLESLVEQQQETIERQRERIAELEGDDSTEEEDDTETVPTVSRRGALTAGGLLALLFGGVGTASADAQGQVGTSQDPLDKLYTDDLYGNSGTITVRDDLDLANSDSIQDSGTEAIQFDGNQNVTFPNGTLDLNSNNVEGVASIKGGLTGGTALTDLQGTGIGISGETLSVEDGGIDTAQLASGAVGSGEIASSAVGSGEIASGAVDTQQINTEDFAGNPFWYLDAGLNLDHGIYSGGGIGPTVDYADLGVPSGTGGELYPWQNIYYQSGGLNEESDGRLKENVRAIDGGLDRLQSIRPVSYELKDRDDPETELGFIAQELEDDIPEVVNEPEDADEYYGVNYIGVIPVAVDAIQELAERLEHLRDRVEELEQQRDSTERIPRAESGKRSARIDSRGSKQDKSGTASRPVTSLLTHLRDQNADLEARLDRIEAHLGIDQPSRQGVTDD